MYQSHQRAPVLVLQPVKICSYALWTNVYMIPVGVASKDSDDTKMTDLIKEKFLVDMPQDFYDFWEFCKDINHTAPEGMLL